MEPLSAQGKGGPAPPSASPSAQQQQFGSQPSSPFVPSAVGGGPAPMGHPMASRGGPSQGMPSTAASGRPQPMPMPQPGPPSRGLSPPQKKTPPKALPMLVCSLFGLCPAVGRRHDSIRSRRADGRYEANDGAARGRPDGDGWSWDGAASPCPLSWHFMCHVFASAALPSRVDGWGCSHILCACTAAGRRGGVSSTG